MGRARAAVWNERHIQRGGAHDQNEHNETQYELRALLVEFREWSVDAPSEQHFGLEGAV